MCSINNLGIGFELLQLMVQHGEIIRAQEAVDRIQDIGADITILQEAMMEADDEGPILLMKKLMQ